MKNNKGESLIEILVSISLLSVVAVVILYSFVYITKLNKKTEDKLSATFVCQQRAEYLYSTSTDFNSLDQNELLNKLSTDFNGIFSGALIDSKGRAYDKVLNESGTYSNKYTYTFTNASDSEFEGFTETITICFSYYYGNLSKVMVEAKKDEDYSKIETTLSWYKKTQ